MKYIKKYNESINFLDIKTNIEDILIDLTDEGFEFNIGKNNLKQITIEIWKSSTGESFKHENNNVFKYSDIEITIKMLNDYLYSAGIEIQNIKSLISFKFNLSKHSKWKSFIFLTELENDNSDIKELILFLYYV